MEGDVSDHYADDDRPSRAELDWLHVKTERGLSKIAKHIGRNRVNCYDGPRLDRTGKAIIMLGWDDKPDSDWGRFRGNRAAIRFGDQDLADKGVHLVREALAARLSSEREG
jgi:hypothetical protein